MSNLLKRAIFLDRDGVINSDEGLYYVTNPAEFRLNEGVIEFLQELQGMGYLLIIISNQGGIAKGLYSHETIREIHRKMKDILSQHGVHITEIYYCPHHPDFGKCLCRKPNTLMIEKAIARFGIDLHKSFLVGDRETDIETAKKAGLKAIKIESNENPLKYLRIIGDS